MHKKICFIHFNLNEEKKNFLINCQLFMLEYLKIAYTKMKSMWLFAHPLLVPNPYDLLSSEKYKIRYLEKNVSANFFLPI